MGLSLVDRVFLFVFTVALTVGVECSQVCDRTPALFHATAEHLIGGDEHDADDESNGEGADQTLPDARLFHLLCRAFG